MDSGGALRVGPESAGAEPGPACYGRGGTRPTVTDACVLLGWIADGAVLGERITVREEAAVRAVQPLADALGLGLPQCAVGIVQVAEATMARALRRVSVERGIDPALLTLLAFGGAGPMCGCDLAALLGVRRVLMPPHAGALSALGMAAAADMAERSIAVHRLADAFPDAADGLATALAAGLEADLPGAEVAYVAECRYVGQGYELDVPCAPGAWGRIAEDFHQVHLLAYGHRDAAAPVEVVELRGVARAVRGLERIRWRRRDTKGPTTRLRLRFPSGLLDAAGYDWDALVSGQIVNGPCRIEGRTATAILPPGWRGRVDDIGAIIAEPGDARTG
jgi:N-methylhydantoinase A